MILLSENFKNKEEMPKESGSKKGNKSPSLIWNEVPENTKSFALIVVDLDSPFKIITHWVIYNIPSDKRKLEEGISHEVYLADGSCQGLNWKREIGYTGPNPPFGKHRYSFKLYALDIILGKEKKKMSKRNLLKIIKNHVIDKAELIGIYSR
jgi:Raf kinase inhibitor-like YbhB/YbcL family protein